jgi:hypothetical protein
MSTPTSDEERLARDNAHDWSAVSDSIQLLAKENALTSLGGERLKIGETHFAADFDGDGEADDLVVTAADASAELDGNHPLYITFAINGAEYSYTDDWNDGIFVDAVDFDADDPYVYIYVFTSSTDIDGHADIYRYDGTTLEQIFSFGVTIYAYYDGAGKIYHVAYTEHYDWITDEKLTDDGGDHIYIADTRTGADDYECPWKD